MFFFHKLDPFEGDRLNVCLALRIAFFFLNPGFKHNARRWQWESCVNLAAVFPINKLRTLSSMLISLFLRKSLCEKPFLKIYLPDATWKLRANLIFSLDYKKYINSLLKFWKRNKNRTTSRRCLAHGMSTGMSSKLFEGSFHSWAAKRKEQLILNCWSSLQSVTALYFGGVVILDHTA